MTRRFKINIVIETKDLNTDKTKLENCLKNLIEKDENLEFIRCYMEEINKQHAY